MKKNVARNGFSLLEVMVAMAIAVLMLTALITLEMKSTALAARSSVGLDTLPIAIERIEELAEIDFTGESTVPHGEYLVVTSTSDAGGGLPATRIQVEVKYNEQTYSELSLYKFRF